MSKSSEKETQFRSEFDRIRYKIFKDVLNIYDGDRFKAAAHLGIHERTIRNFSKKYSSLNDYIKNARPIKDNDMLGNRKWWGLDDN